MIDLGRETDGFITAKFVSVSVFALCIIKALRLARIEHCSGTVVTLLLHSIQWIPQQGLNPVLVKGVSKRKKKKKKEQTKSQWTRKTVLSVKMKELPEVRVAA